MEATSGTDVGPRVAAVVLAAGSGQRMMADQNKVFMPLRGRPVIAWSLQSMARVGAVERLVVVVREQDRELAGQTIARDLDGIEVDVVVGGITRRQSELFALRHLSSEIACGDINLVLIHDGARPLLSPRSVETLIQVAFAQGAAYPALLAQDIRRVRPDGTLDMLDQGMMLRAQTPQAFLARPLLAAHESAEIDAFDGPDTVSCWERYEGTQVRWVPGDRHNIKITYPEDLLEAERLLGHAQFPST